MKEAKAWDRNAKDYFSQVVSPFAEGVVNPLFEYIDKVTDAKNKSVIDIGTGIGNLLPELVKRFGHVAAVDISPEMIKHAKEKVEGNVEFSVRDMRDLSEFHNKFDVAISVNSVLAPDIFDVDRIIKEIHNVLKAQGILLAIFPSMDSILHQSILLYEKARESGKPHEKALEETREKIKRDSCDFLLGTFKYNDMVQKHYYPFEIKYRLKKAGFKAIKLRKVYYPWEVYEEDHLLELNDKPKSWDWFVYAEK